MGKFLLERDRGIIMKFLKLLYNAWMKLAHALGWLNTRIILTLVYILIFTPIALFFRLIGKDLMERRLEAVESYWLKRGIKEFKPEDYRRQF